MLDRIAELRAQAEAEIAAAGTSAEIEEARVKHLGRKAELPNLLRGVAQLAPEERGKVGKAANEARQALEARAEQPRGARGPPGLDMKLAPARVDATLPGALPQP